MKRILSGVMAFLLILSLIPSIPLTANAYSSGYYTYTVSNGEATITECSTYISGNITIPSTLGGYPVTSIGADAFNSCDSLTSVTIPDSVTGIGAKAFYSCDNLTSVTIPDSVTSVGAFAFYFCDNLTDVYVTDITAWCKITFEGSSANPLYYDGNLYLNGEIVTDLVVPDLVTIIGDYAFFSYGSLSSVTIGNGVTTIGDNAFGHCDNLTSVTIPDSITHIGDSAFYYCDNLTSVSIGNGVTSIGEDAFYSCGSLTSVTIPGSVTSIGDYAFRSCHNLTSVTIPDSVSNIGVGAFAGCSKMCDFQLSENNPNYSLDSQGVLFNKDKTELLYAPNKNVNGAYVVPDGVTTIGDYAFYYCDELTSAILPDSVTTIGGHAFTGSDLTEITIPKSVISIGDSAFYLSDLESVCYDGDKNDRTNITIGRDNTKLTGANWYYNCCDAGSHDYDNACDDVCNICSYQRKITHSYDDANDVTCNICKATLAPNAPKLKSVTSVTDTTVTLADVDGYEYSIDGTSWQKSNIFTGLQPFTSYSFYQRVAASPDNLVSPASLPLTVKTDKYMPDAPTPPTVNSKTGTSVTLQSQAGCEYSMDGAVWQESNVFTGLTPVTEYTFYQRIAETSNGYASASSQPITVTTLRTFTVTYNARGGTPTPEAQTKDEGVPLELSAAEPGHNRYIFKGWSDFVYGEVVYTPGGYYREDKDITLYAVWVKYCSNCGGDGHTSVTCSLCDGTGEWWGDISTCCYARTAYITITHGSSGYLCLDCGKVCDVEYGSASCDKTKEISCQSCSGLGYGKLTPPAAPQPKLLSATLSSITVVAQSGMEYSIDGVTWQVSNVFEDLLPNTQYTVYQRYEENDYYNAGQTSEALSVSTLTNYTVVFKDWDGTVLSTNTYQYGDAVIAPANPTKATDHIASYTFAGWDNEVVNCTGNATYTATYNATYIDYTVVFKNWNGTVLSTETYHWGDTVTTPANPSRPSDDTYIYTFAGWDKMVIACCGNAEYTAAYSSQTRVPSTITSSVYTVSSTTISKITAGTTVSAFLSGFNEGSYCKVYKGNTEVGGSTVVGTGMVVKIMDGNTVKASYTVIVTGDTNGDGNITVTDMIAIKAHVLKKSTLSGVYATAADTNGDKGISITDFIQVKAKILGKGTITAR